MSQLGHAAGLSPHAGARDNFGRLRTLLGSSAPAEDVDALAALLGLARDGAPSAPARTPENRKRETIAALLRRFRRLSESAPVLCVFEDLHWSDASTLEFLDELLGELEGLAALILLTFRPEFAVPWAGQACTTLLTLGRMGFRDSLRMVQSAWREAGLPADLAESIARRADGVPLFIEELTQAAVELPSLELRRDDVGGVESAQATIPETLRDALMSRLDRSAPAREVAQLASVIGRDFDYSTLAAASTSPAEALRQGIESLAESGLVQIRGDLPDASCRFRHSLIRDVAYATLTRRSRMTLHGSVAKALLGTKLTRSSSGRKGGVPVAPQLIAYHLTEAGNLSEALDHWERAGQDALDRGAPPEAAANFARGIELMPGLQDTAENRRRELSLLFRLGQAQFGAFGGAAPETIETFRRAAELAREWGDSSDECRAQYGRWVGLLISGRLDEGFTISSRVAELARGSGSEWQNVLATRLAATPLYLSGRLRQARAALEHVVSSPQTHDEALTGFAHNPSLTTPSTLAHVEWSLGYPDAALERSTQAVAKAQAQPGDPNTLPYALTWHCMLALLRREPSRAQETARLLTDHAERTGGKFWLYLGRWLHGGSKIIGGNPEEGLLALREGLSGYTETGALQHVPFAKLFEAEAFLRTGDFQESSVVLDEVAKIVEATGQRFYEPELCRLRGDMHRALGQGAEAQAQYRRAMELAVVQESRAWQLRASTSLSRLWCAEGKHGEAAGLLAPLCSGFTEGFETPDFVEARTLLEELS